MMHGTNVKIVCCVWEVRSSNPGRDTVVAFLIPFRQIPG